MAIAPPNPICTSICDALGLKNVRSLELRMAVGEAVTIRVEYFPDLDELKRLNTVLSDVELVRTEYNLVAKREGQGE
jgi:hypothetical protein